MPEVFDVVVVGAGMFGAAAAKYLAGFGARTAVVGPGEPATTRDATPAAFSAHYDRARITRRLGWDEVWGEFDARSLARFRAIEAESGVDFFHECGSLVLMAGDITTRTDSIVRGCEDRGIKIERLTAAELECRFPMLKAPPMPDGVEGLYEPAHAGYLDPRALVAAQMAIAQRIGTRLIRGAASAIQRDAGAKVWRLRISDGTEIAAPRILLATGAITNHLGLLPASWPTLALHVFQEPNLLVEVPPERLDELQSLPPVVTVDSADTGDANASSYLIPPVRYDDGRWYVRIGPGMQPIVAELDSASAMIEWYREQQITDAQRNFLTGAVTQLLPGLSTERTRAATCLIEKTPTRVPYLGPLRPEQGFWVALGGNGHGARGSDEIGRLAARQVLELPWDCPLDEQRFAPLPADVAFSSGSRPGFLKPPFGLC